MDKSEGTDFISKTFSSLTDKVAKLYRAGHQKVSLTSMKNAYEEKLAVLGSKVFQLLKEGKTVTKVLVKAEYESVIRMESDIKDAEKKYNAMKSELAKKRDESKPTKIIGKTAKSKTNTKKKTAVSRSRKPKSVKPQPADE